MSTIVESITMRASVTSEHVGGADSDNIEVNEYGSEDAKIIDVEVVEAVKSQEGCEDEMLCEKCDEAQEEVCMPVGLTKRAKLREEFAVLVGRRRPCARSMSSHTARIDHGARYV